jgi:hypothetical protein
VIRAAADAHVRTTFADADADDPGALDAQQFLISLALRTTARTWPELRDAANERHRESIAAFAEFYAYLMEAYGLRMRPPDDHRLHGGDGGDGRGLRHPRPGRPGAPAVHQHGRRRGTTGEWTLFAFESEPW